MTEAIIALLTLTFLEVILGVDNIIFIAIISNKLPVEKRKLGRNLGLIMAMLLRLGLLFAIAWIIKLDKQPLFDLWGIHPTVKDLILCAGGLFLLGKSTTEIHHKLEGNEVREYKQTRSFTSAVVQITLINLVFSFDSILTTIGLTQILWIMVTSVIISVIIMIIFGGKISNFIAKHPTLEMLALSFLILVGFMLVVEGMVFIDGEHVHVPKGYVYFAVAFSLLVEVLNMRLRKRKHPVKLHDKPDIDDPVLKDAPDFDKQKHHDRRKH